MIARLNGIVAETGEDWAIIDVGGVGYLVFCPGKTLQALPKSGESVVLHIETHVREDHIHLYGFTTRGEKEWFRRLQSVQGVGAKVALALLSILTPSELAQAVAMQDRTMIGRASGVGPKLAARIVAELKDKVSSFEGMDAPVAGAAAPTGEGRLADAVSALVNLGYRPADAMGAVARVNRAQGGEASLESLIRGGLKELAG
ncbi:Holliday junction branch migration protein RuvA [Iodidimonas sp. SYSU 1G8]|uniref:Holliday junction branch migration protein RuvA n=1 Tax=Iodidimonas sp. SYSU 1G8 TaxID=3133967 RepID=UPI0031FF3F16